ncbi:MAG: serine/threonine protein kinase [Deltaproteobacteria bacterium]|nr:serine/threonine protein kinase [Deltaproteobacteria bacterium]
MSEESQKLGQYTLLAKVAQGGMAQVFKAKTVDPNGFERLVVIKRILPHISADPEYVEMLVDEAKIAVNFTHGNIAQIYDLGRVKDDYFIVMEYVDGKTFSQINKKLKLREKKIPLDILLYCTIETCRGLNYIHNKKGTDGKPMGVVHRDISPQNIILSYAGQIKIIDFGVAKARNKEGKTESGVLKGKFAYMSPEQSRSDVIDNRSDIFSMGTLLWESLTGERLFKKKTNQETVKAIQKGKYINAASIRPDTPKELDKIIRKALQKNPKHRYQDADDMALDLEKLLFVINPDFKPVYAAEFVYRLFGPEDDEKDLPDHLFVKEKTPVTRLNTAQIALKKPCVPQEELTVKDVFDAYLTPITKIKKTVRANLRLMWLFGFFVFLFVCGAIYFYLFSVAAKASISFEGLKKEMSIFINDLETKPPDSGIFALKSESQYNIRVSQKGYQDFVAHVFLKPFEHQIIKPKFNILALETGMLTIKTVPPGATVYLNNIKWKEITPVVIKNFEPDKPYKIGLFLEKYSFFTKEITFEKGKPLVLEHKFVKNTAYISVTSNPIGADVYINGAFAGKTPYQNNNVVPDQALNINVKNQGYRQQEKKVQLKNGEEMTVNFELEKN